MKRITLLLLTVLAFAFSLNAQQFVSTEPANRNVILEEYTGRNCGYCTDGHAYANQIMNAHPGRVWAINIHYGSLSPTSYPNLNVPEINPALSNAFPHDGIPSGVINRSTPQGQNRGAWTGLANTQLNQAAECNVGGMVVVNPETRVATITVEVYYTGNSSSETNYLTVAMLQDSILGPQSDYGNYNPSQWIGNQYVHQHTLRAIISDNIWGDAVAPTTQGSLVTLTYSYVIPETIGNPNGVAVDLDNIHFLAFVAERFQGTPTRPILNACQLEMVQGTDEPIYPSIVSVNQPNASSCTHSKEVELNIQNIGTETLTSMTFEVEVEGETQTINWEGQLPQYGVEKIAAIVEVPFGTHPIHVALTEANGEPMEKSFTGSVECLEWQEVEIEGDEEELRVEIMQDKFGNHITWDFTTPDGTVLASGGPYTMLAAGAATQLHIEHVTIPADECAKFTIYDQMANGICCSFGHGYYIVKDSQGNVLFGDEDDGEFGESASHLVSIRGPQAQVEVSETEVSNISYTHADFVASLSYEGYPEEVGFECRKVTSPEPIIVAGFLNEFRKILGQTDELEASSIYMVKAFAVVNGETYYGAETTFQTWTEGVNELGQNLKIYPNPATSALNIEGEGMTSIEVYNTVGQLVMKQEVNGNKTQMNTESLSNGLYVIHIYANDGTMQNHTFSVAR